MSKELEAAIIADDAGAVAAAIAATKDLDKKLPRGQTPVMLACDKGASRALTALLDAGANVKGTAKDAFHHPFFAAVMNGHLEIVKLLASRSEIPADVIEQSLGHAGRKNKNELLQFILEKFRPPISIHTIRETCFAGNVSGLRLLGKAGADFNMRNESPNAAYATALHAVMILGNPELIETLVEFGAKVNVQDKRGRTPLMVLAKKAYEMDQDAHMPAYRAKKHGVSLADVKQANDRRYFSEEMIRLMIRLGADAAIKDTEGHDAIDYYRIAWQ